jgi:hypothetical protein
MVEFKKFETGRTDIRLSDTERQWAEETSVEEGERMLREVGFYAAKSGEIQESQSDMNMGIFMEENIFSTDGVIRSPASQVALGYTDYHQLQNMKRETAILEEQYGIEEGGAV